MWESAKSSRRKGAPGMLASSGLVDDSKNVRP
jgi:hypothetical protein